LLALDNIGLMRGILKSVGVVSLSLYFTQQLIPTIQFSEFSYFLILSGLIYLANYIISPLTKILFFLPITLIILGLLHILANFLVLFLASSSFEEFEVGAFNFEGLTAYGFIVAPFNFSTIQTAIVAAVVIAIIYGFLNWLTE